MHSNPVTDPRYEVKFRNLIGPWIIKNSVAVLYFLYLTTCVVTCESPLPVATTGARIMKQSASCPNIVALFDVLLKILKVKIPLYDRLCMQYIVLTDV